MSKRVKLMRIFVGMYDYVRKLIASTFNLAEMKKKFGAHGRSVLGIRIYDNDGSTIIYASNIRLGDTEPEQVGDNVKPDVLLESDYNTAFDILDGQIKRKTVKGTITQPYSIFDAQQDGRLHVKDNRSDELYLTDLLLFQELYRQVLPALREHMGVKAKT